MGRDELPPAGDDAQDRAARDAADERWLSFQRDALAGIDITSAADLDEACDVLDDATLALVLATNPLAPESEAALPARVQEFLRKARQGIN